MLYSPERSSLAGTAETGSALSPIILPAGVHSGRSHTPLGVKDGNGSSMGRGYKSIDKLSAFSPRAFSLLLLCGLAAFGSATAHAQSAKTWDKRGQAAESHQDFDTAYEDFKHATQKAPNDLRFKEHYERARFQAAVAHVDQGRVLRQSGDLNGALAQFNRALQIDGGNQTAQQEIDQIQKQVNEQPAGAPPGPSEQMSRQNETLASIGSISGPVELKPISTDPITLHMVEDVKVIYQAIGKATGMNILFDPD